MRNDRDDKYEGHEESEYHFSDDEVSYEVEPESPKPPTESSPKESLGSRLTRSKRLLISLGVFLVLVFVVYKMVSPTTSSPATDITTPAVVQTKPSTPAGPSPQQPVVTPAPTSPAVTSPTGTPMAPSPTVVVQAPATPGVVPPLPPTAQPAPVQTVTQTPTMPPVIPVQSTVTTNVNVPPPVQPSPLITQAPAVIDAGMASVSATNDKLSSQLEAEYNQKVSVYEAQNKALQDQVQVLNSRVASMETQINQLVRALTRESREAEAVPAQPPQSVEPRSVYNVQAIIPGRAWLRSDNGETVTVAEGDVIRDLGRVTKIDPYDGVVEINTGSKVISLSYGNGG